MNHKYRVTSGGEFVPGVTTIIGIIDKPAFKWTSAKIAAETAIENMRRKRTIVPVHRKKLASYRGNNSTSVKNRELATFGTDNEIFVHYCRGEFDRQWRAKATRGNRVHDVAERWTRGEDVDVIEEDSRYVDALEAFHLQYRPIFLLTECVVLNDSLVDEDGNPLHYGGRFDAIAILHHEVWDEETGESHWEVLGTFLLDYKTGGQWEDSVAMQTIGYMKCALPIYVDDKLTGLKDLPHLDGARIVYLQDDGTVAVKDPFERIPEAVAWKAFKGCLNLFIATKQIESLLGEEEEE